MRMVLKTLYFLSLVCQLIVRLPAKPKGLVASPRNLVPVNLDAARGRAPNSSVFPPNQIPASSNLTRNVFSTLQHRRKLVASTKPKRPINGEENAFVGEGVDGNKNGGVPRPNHDLSEKFGEIQTFMLEVQNGDFVRLPMINPSYNELKSDKCYVLFEKLQEDASTFGFSFNIFYWIGRKSSPTDAAAAASGAVTVDAQVHPDVQIYREVEGHESLYFRLLFRDNDGGLIAKMQTLEEADVGLKETNSTSEKDSKNVEFLKNSNGEIKVTRIYDDGSRVGEENVQEYDITIGQLNDDDCYLIDSCAGDVGIFAWMGKNTKNKLNLRKEVASRAELYLREQSENSFKTPITFVDRTVTLQHWTIEDMIKFLSGNMYY